jgi:pimeloyl-ACP methyl ester carboxylesterase
VEKNVKLHVIDLGEGQPVVLIHEWPLDNEMYEYQYQYLVEKGFRVIGISLRGFGKSDRPYGKYDFDTFSDDIKVVLEKLKIENATLGGFSMGNAVKLHFVAKYNGAHISKLAKSSLHRFFLSILKQKSLPSQRIWPEYNRFQQQYKSKHTVADYANFLCMAPKTITYKFNRLRLPQPNEVIKNRIILEAKRFLVHTSLTAKELSMISVTMIRHILADCFRLKRLNLHQVFGQTF